MKQKKSLKKVGMELPKHLQHINVNAAGIDIGSRSHFVAVPEGADEKPVREFSGFTGDLERMAEWLISCGVTTVAMESTGIYWIPVFEILESHGLEVKLVNARHVKNVPGRKSDVLDCQWRKRLTNPSSQPFFFGLCFPRMKGIHWEASDDQSGKKCPLAHHHREPGGKRHEHCRLLP